MADRHNGSTSENDGLAERLEAVLSTNRQQLNQVDLLSLSNVEIFIYTQNVLERSEKAIKRSQDLMGKFAGEELKSPGNPHPDAAEAANNLNRFFGSLK